MDSILKVHTCRDVKLPARGTKDSSGIDFFIPNDLVNLKITPENEIGHDSTGVNPMTNEIEIQPGTGVLIPTGIKTIIKAGYDLVFDNKSGIAVKKGLVIGAKVIDSDYRGEIHIHLINTSNHNQSVFLGDKVAQAILRPVLLDLPINISEAEFNELAETERGEGGFGSTGTK